MLLRRLAFSLALLPSLCGGQQQPALWPQPASATFANASVSLDAAAFAFLASPGSSSPLLSRAMARYTALTFQRVVPAVWPPLPPPSGALTALLISIASPSQELALNTSERYTLELPVGGGTAALAADTVYGALRGLETFSQLVGYDGAAAFAAPCARVDDAPRFAWRGALIDTSRHFQPVAAIQAFIDALAQAKMNVAHWHIVDSESFPYVSAAFPLLSARGAYNAPAATHTYAPADVAGVVAFAKDRGVRVVVEFDTPGHSLSWGAGQPGLLTACYTNGSLDGTFGPIDPTLDSTWAFLTALFAETARVFPDGFMHVGGDEVSYDCWQSSPTVAAWMAAHGMANNFSALESYYVQRVLGIVQALGKSSVAYQEVFDNGLELPPNLIVDAWKNPFSTGQIELAKVTAAGYTALMSSGYYVNYEAYVTGGQWRQIYTQDPHDFNGTAAQKKLVIGAEFSLWSEFIDATNLISRAFPTGAALAERLWSPASVVSLDDAAVRLQGHTCRMLVRGIPAEPPSGPSFCPTEWAFAYSPPTL